MLRGPVFVGWDFLPLTKRSRIVRPQMGADDFIRKLPAARWSSGLGRGSAAASPRSDRRTEEPSARRASDRGLSGMDPSATRTWRMVSLMVMNFSPRENWHAVRAGEKSRNAPWTQPDDQVYVDDRTIDSHIKRGAQEVQGSRHEFEMIETCNGASRRLRKL